MNSWYRSVPIFFTLHHIIVLLSPMIACAAEAQPDYKVSGAWQGGRVLDCGDPGYRSFLMEQVQRHLTNYAS